VYTNIPMSLIYPCYIPIVTHDLPFEIDVFIKLLLKP